MDESARTELFDHAVRAIARGEYRRAEYMLWEVLAESSGSARSTFFLGVSMLLQLRFSDARRIIDRAHGIDPTLDDRFRAPDRTSALREALVAQPGWTWPAERLHHDALKAKAAARPRQRRISSARIARRARRLLKAAAGRIRFRRTVANRGPTRTNPTHQPETAEGRREPASDERTRDDERFQAARQQLRLGRPGRGGQSMRELLRENPKAPTVRYLAGVAHLLCGRFDQARRFIDRAYDLRLFVNDRIGMPMSLESLQRAMAELPNWEWPRYQTSRERWRGIGVSLEDAVEHLKEWRGERPTFVNIGANDGARDDPLRWLMHRRSVQGLLVEPQPEPYALLVSNYGHIDGFSFENAAVTETEGPVEIITTPSRTTLGSITPERTFLHRFSDELRSLTVTGRRFDNILTDHAIDRFDVLQIDTEGFDFNVLRQVDLRARGVSIVNMEYYHLPVIERVAACEQLEQAGFALFFTRRDVLALDRELFGSRFYITDICRPRPRALPSSSRAQQSKLKS